MLDFLIQKSHQLMVFSSATLTLIMWLMSII